MTQEIIEMAQECGLVGMRPHLDGIYSEALVAFAKLVAEKALAEHAMREVQRLGQEIEQEPVAKYSDIVSDGGLDPRNKFDTPPQRTWVGLTEEDMYVVSEEESCSFIAGAKWSEAILREKNT